MRVRFQRWWSPEIARGLILTYMAAGAGLLGLVLLRQGLEGKSITRLGQRVVVLERATLCATRQECRQLFDELVAAATRSQERRIRARLGFVGLRSLENELALRLARAHRRSHHRMRRERLVPLLPVSPVEPVRGVMPGKSEPFHGRAGRSLLPSSVPAPLRAKEPRALLHSPPVAGKLRVSLPRSTVRKVRTGSEHLHAEVSPLLGAPKVAPGSPVRTVTGRIPSTIVAGRHIPAK